MIDPDQAPVATLPPRLILAGALAACTGVGIAHLLPPPPGLAVLWVAGALAAVTIAAVAGHRQDPAAVTAWLVLLVGAGLLRGAVAAPGGPGLADSMPGPGTLVGTVAAAPVAHRGEVVVVVDVDTSSTPGNPGGALALALPGRSDALPGDRVEVEVARLRPPDDRPGPLSALTLGRQGIEAVAVSPRLTVLARGGPGVARAVAELRGRIAAEVDAAVPEPSADLLDGIAFGIHRPLPAALAGPLQDAGLAHLQATSGLKVAIVAGLVGRLLGLLAAGPRLSLLVRLGAVGGFVVLAGGGPAAVRSAVTASTATMLRRRGRRADPLVLLGLVTTAMLMADPGLCGDVGFQLTALGTLGILLLADPLASRLPGPRVAVEPLALTVAAGLLTLPVQAEAFGVVSLAGPVANALAIPMVPAVMVLGWLGVALTWVAPPLGGPPLAGAGALTGAVAALARAVSSVPGAALHPAVWPRLWSWVAAALVVSSLGAAWWWRRGLGAPSGAGGVRPPAPVGRTRDHGRRLAAGAGLAVLGCAAAGGAAVAATRPDGRLHVRVLDVGAGTAVLVRAPSGGLALVDAGPDPQRLLTALGPALPPLTRTIDQLVLTGGERAVTGGLTDLAAHYRVTRVLVPDASLGSGARTQLLGLRDAGAAVEVVPAGAAWTWGGAAWRCAGTGLAGDGSGPVLAACALQVAATGASALVLGDLGAAQQDQLAATEGPGLRSDLLVTPPTGALSASLAAAAGPRSLAVPCARPPSLRPGGGAERTTAEDGTLDYVAGPAGLEPG